MDDPTKHNEQQSQDHAPIDYHVPFTGASDENSSKVKYTTVGIDDPESREDYKAKPSAQSSSSPQPSGTLQYETYVQYPQMGSTSNSGVTNRRMNMLSVNNATKPIPPHPQVLIRTGLLLKSFLVFGHPLTHLWVHSRSPVTLKRGNACRWLQPA
jgi:hypothetical protein